MLDISNFFQKFLHLEKSLGVRKETIVQIIHECTGVTLSKEMIDIERETLTLRCSPVYRNEIFMHREAIENALKEKKIFLKLR